MFERIQALQAAGTTIFLVEQNAYRALSIADRAYVFEAGRLILADTGEELMENERIKAARLGLSRPIGRGRRGGVRGRADREGRAMSFWRSAACFLL